MKKFNKASLVIAPMALMLFSSSLNIPKVMADDNGSWGSKIRNEQEIKMVNDFQNQHTNRELEQIASNNESLIADYLITISNYIENNYNNDVQSNLNKYNNEINKVQNDTKDSIKKSIEDLRNELSHAQIYDINTHFKEINSINEDISDQKLSDIKNNIIDNYKLLIEYTNKSYENLKSQDGLIKTLIPQAKNATKMYEDKSKQTDNSHNLKYEILKDFENSTSDMRNISLPWHFTHYGDLSNSLEKIMSKYVTFEDKIDEVYEMLSPEKDYSNESMDLGAEIIKLKKQLNNINSTPSNYVPVSNNSNVNSNNDELKNELNNAKNNINNIINKNVELSNTTSSLKNEIETLKQQVHELKNNKKSKHKNTKANKRALNQKKKELNKVNKELKKHIRKSNKKKLIQKRNSILKSIKKLNK
ncbi:hypothetical protein DY120_04165 [Apilactobacillus micheneri]|uniref:Uncharacterized protein n=1 Tax=Apilactobacillus micheneri TaxID=1899430 RepID=A0ABY2YW04_9LACO|nr:hypothetical protein [Apilactobacillus micheneri]TPR24482.1 hypothetical protein DY114_04165 [Apilactobacillus micheneri]TPR25793.1 hypothetical protein DY111_04165 [Apilactobacillus micheneri]TPR27983.1 hypothetical protein DY113_02110 [Apilactobacillus micheneri]TPR29474.1 hypothetical protein DY117_04165 [Apilactobacillus micheneri]TPR30260.1 hypothetical protein DY120_04165 [Apilactobacillus micheneri]